MYSEKAIALVNKMTKKGCMFLFPTILLPSHNMKASQKIYIMLGVPKFARHKKAVDRVVSAEPIRATSDLNQRFRSKTRKNAAKAPNSIDGSLTEYSVRPKIFKQSFCTL